MTSLTSNDDKGVAIIGMSGRFPDAKNIDQFWENLCDSKEMIYFFTDEELLSAGVPFEHLNHKEYVKARAILDDVDLFDAPFFGINPKEAAIMDPQHRLFLECAWKGMEDASFNPNTFSGRVGVFVSSGSNTYMLNNLYPNRHVVESVGFYQTMIGNDKDFLPTRISYLFNLKGPSVAVQTACSSSLVAVHYAIQSLLSGESDVAVTGGVAVRVPEHTGYLYTKDGIHSSDGHCRPFDSESSGTVSGNGMGVVVLKRLSDAIEDHDYIYAVIKGSAVNNDGLDKIGYTAPSINGQARVIAEAHALAGFHPNSIAYIEAHGTATSLGDPIEVAALTKAFRLGTQRKGYCAIGSVKSNIGHLDVASGITGLIKTVKILQSKQIPSTLHFKHANVKTKLEESPFYVNQSLTALDSTGTPCRAGVSSFGIGGTNAHVALEEAPFHTKANADKTPQLFVFSAKTESALKRNLKEIADYLRDRKDQISLQDAAYSLQVGRSPFAYRKTFIADTADALYEQIMLESSSPAIYSGDPAKVIFVFPEQVVKVHSLIMELFISEPFFKEKVKHCLVVLQNAEGSYQNEEILNGEAIHALHPEQALFIYEYGLAQLMLHWGIMPESIMGQGVGELAAACVAEIFTLEQAMQLLSKKGVNTAFAIEELNFSEPKISLFSTILGKWITELDTGSINYWIKELNKRSQTVEVQKHIRWSENSIYIEFGGASSELQIIEQDLIKRINIGSELSFDFDKDAVPHPIKQAVWGQLWCYGYPLHWEKYYGDIYPYKIPLPSYSFDPHRFWIDEPAKQSASQYNSFIRPASDHQTSSLIQSGNHLSIPEVLAVMWKELLGVEHVTESDDFFELGGHSLLATQLLSQIRHYYEVDIGLMDLFEQSTITDMVNLIESNLNRAQELSLEEILKEVQELSPDEVKEFLMKEISGGES